MTFSEKTLQAARAVLSSRNPSRADLRRTATPQRDPLSVRDAASAYKVSKSAVQRAVGFLGNPLPRGRGRPMALTDDEDDALVAYVQWMERTGMPATREQLEGAANTIRLRRNPNASGVSPNWLTGWRRSHPEVTQTYLKAVERSRKAFEVQGPEDTELFYSQLQATILKFRIGASEIWNEDEAGMRIGCLRERVQVLVTRTSRHKGPRPEVLDPANRESCTLIACINAVGDSLPPWLVFAHYPTTSWAGIDIGTGVRFAQSPTGFSNAEIHLEWARHFNRWSWASSAQAKQSGKSLEQWFGCDEHLRLPDRGMSRVDKPPVERPEEEKIYRLLVVDGFTGHTTLAFAEYCIKFDIIIAILPPHSTHLMQPLDVGVFQPLKAAHQKALRKSLADGNLAYSRVDFLAAFQRVYEAGFTKHNIMSGFEETGLWPASAQPVLAKLLQEQLRQRKRINPAYTSLLPSETRFQVAADAANDIRERYHDILSSPSREGLRQIAKVSAESLILHTHSNEFVVDRTKRIQAYANRKKRGKTVKPSGEFVTSSSMDDIVRESDRLLDSQTKERTRKELRMHISQVKGQMQKIRDDYKKTKRQEVNGRIKQLNFKPWLVHTGRDVEFYLLEQSHDHLTQEIKKPSQEIYFVDTTKRNNSARDIMARAMTRPHPLQDMSSLPGSDDTVDFPGLGSFHDQEEENNSDDDLWFQFHDAQEYMPSSPPPAVVGEITKTPCPVKPTRRYHRIQGMLKDYRDEKNSSQGHSTGENTT